MFTYIRQHAHNNSVPTAGKVITWSKTGTGGSFASATSNTNESGLATVEFTVGTTVGLVHTVTAKSDANTLTGTSPAITTVTGVHSAYKITAAVSNPQAGTPNQLTITVVDRFGNTITSFNGQKTLTFSGLSNAPNGSVPTVSNDEAVAINLGLPTTITFSDGVSLAGGSLVARKAESSVTLHCSDGTYSTSTPGGSGALLTVTNRTVANLKAFLQGPYSSGSMSTSLNSGGYLPVAHPYSSYNGTESILPGFFTSNTSIVDWVLIELRSAPTTKVASRAAFIKNDGTIVEIDGSSAVAFNDVAPGSYYIVIRHRNHLAIMSAAPVALSASSALYNFTTAQAQAYGTNPMSVVSAGVFGMIAGDADATGDIGALDRTATWNERNLTGYRGSDVDLSGDVSALDRTIMWNNRNLLTRLP